MDHDACHSQDAVPVQGRRGALMTAARASRARALSPRERMVRTAAQLIRRKGRLWVLTERDRDGGVGAPGIATALLPRRQGGARLRCPALDGRRGGPADTAISARAGIESAH